MRTDYLAFRAEPRPQAEIRHARSDLRII